VIDHDEVGLIKAQAGPEARVRLEGAVPRERAVDEVHVLSGQLPVQVLGDERGPGLFVRQDRDRTRRRRAAEKRDPNGVRVLLVPHLRRRDEPVGVDGLRLSDVEVGARDGAVGAEGVDVRPVGHRVRAGALAGELLQVHRRQREPQRDLDRREGDDDPEQDGDQPVEDLALHGPLSAESALGF
jgi:hypothetical protein